MIFSLTASRRMRYARSRTTDACRAALPPEWRIAVLTGRSNCKTLNAASIFQFQSTFVKRRRPLPTFGSGKHRDTKTRFAGHKSLRAAKAARKTGETSFRVFSCPPKAAFVSDGASCPQGGKIATARFERARTCAATRSSRSANAD